MKTTFLGLAMAAAMLAGALGPPAMAADDYGSFDTYTQDTVLFDIDVGAGDAVGLPLFEVNIYDVAYAEVFCADPPGDGDPAPEPPVGDPPTEGSDVVGLCFYGSVPAFRV